MKVIDMHCDTAVAVTFKNADIRSNDMHIDLLRMHQGDYLMQCFAICEMLNRGDAFNKCDKHIAGFKKMMEDNKDLIHQIYSYEELVADDSVKALLTIEEGGVIEGSIEKLKHFYDLGVRMMTLTWNFENEIGHPNIMTREKQAINTETGLKDFGYEVIDWMNTHGMIVDVSHGSDKLFYDVLGCSKKPIVCSHSSARSVNFSPRNLSDEMIRALADKGGLTGVNFCPDFIWAQDPNVDNTEYLVRHIKHIVNVGGIDVCGLGTDFDGIQTPNGINSCDKMPKLAIALSEAGFKEEEIEKIFYKNFERIFKENSVN